MTKQDQYEGICQRVVRKHYRDYRKVVADPFFVNSEEQARAQLTKMLCNARAEAEAAIYIDRRDFNSREIAEIILGKYLNIGRKYGERYYTKVLEIR